MNIEALKQLIELANLMDSTASAVAEPPQKEMIGDYVIVRCRDAGVHAGTLVSYEGREVVLKNSRRLWYWVAAQGISLSAVAEHGLKSGSKIPEMVSKIMLVDACEIILCSDTATKSISEWPASEVD